MICVIIILALAVSHVIITESSVISAYDNAISSLVSRDASDITRSINDVTLSSFEEKGGEVVSNDKSLKKLVNSSMRAVDVVERSSPPYIFRWSDGRREQGRSTTTAISVLHIKNGLKLLKSFTFYRQPSISSDIVFASSSGFIAFRRPPTSHTMGRLQLQRVQGLRVPAQLPLGLPDYIHRSAIADSE